MSKPSISLADAYCDYAISQSSQGHHHKLAAMSDRDFMATPHDERDIPWLAHAIQRYPSFKMELDFAKAMTDVLDEHFLDPEDAKKYGDVLERNPELYSLPFPVMWIEWDGGATANGHLKNGILLEDLSVHGIEIESGAHQNVGIKVTLFGSNDEGRLYPSNDLPIPIAYGTPKDMRTARMYVKGTAAFYNRKTMESDEHLSEELRGMSRSAYSVAMSVLTLLNSRTDLKVVPPLIFDAKKVGDGYPQEDDIQKPLDSLTFNSTDAQLATLALTRGDARVHEPSNADKLTRILERRYSVREALDNPVHALMAPTNILGSSGEIAKAGKALEAAGEIEIGDVLPGFDFTHQIHGSDEWYINNEKRLRPLAELFDEEKLKVGILDIWTPVFKPHELSSIDALQRAFEKWHARMHQYLQQGFDVTWAYKAAERQLEKDYPEHQMRIPEYVEEFQNSSPAWINKTSPVSNDVRDAISVAFQNKKFMPLPFAILLAQFGTHFVIADEAAKEWGQKFGALPGLVVMGAGVIKDLQAADEYHFYSRLSHLLIRAVSAEMQRTGLYQDKISQLLDTKIPSKELPFLTFGPIDSSKLIDAIGILHGRHYSDEFHSIFFQIATPECLATYRAFLNAATAVAIEVRGDLNNALENSRVDFAFKEQPELIKKSTTDFSHLSNEPLIIQVPERHGTPPKKSVDALIQAYVDLLPSTRDLYRRRPVAFLLTNSSQLHDQLTFQNSNLGVGVDYLDPVKIRRWFTGIPLKPGQPITIGNMEEDAIRAAASRGLIKGALHLQLDALGGDKASASVLRFEKEVKQRLPSKYTDTKIKRTIVGAIIGEVCASVGDLRLQKKFPASAEFAQRLPNYHYTWDLGLKTKSKEIMQAGERAFTINTSPGILTAPQRKLFETVNGLMGELDVTAEDMDDAFRFEVFKMQNWLQNQENGWFKENKREAVGAQTEDEAKVEADRHVLSAPIYGFDITRQPLALMTLFSLSAYEYALQGKFYPTNLVPPSYISEEHVYAFEEMETLQEEMMSAYVAQKREREKPYDPSIGILQKYAYGSTPLEILPDAFGQSFLYKGYLPEVNSLRASSEEVATEILSNIGHIVTNDDRIAENQKVDSRLSQWVKELTDIQRQILAGERPSFEKIFELAILRAAGGYINHTYADGKVPASVQEKYLELKGLFSPVNVPQAPYGLVFQSEDTLWKLERGEFVAPEVIENSIVRKKAVQVTEDITLSELPAPQTGDRAPVEVDLYSTVIQRIFREAGKAHPNNSPERREDVARMEWLSEQLKALASLERMNAQYAPHAELANVMFSDDIMRTLESAHLAAGNAKVKVPLVPQATRERFIEALRAVFAITPNEESVTGDDFNRNEKLKQNILEFPGLVIAGLGDERAVKELRNKYTLPLHSKIPPYVESDAKERADLITARDRKAKSLMAAAGIIDFVPELEVVAEPVVEAVVQPEVMTAEEPFLEPVVEEPVIQKIPEEVAEPVIDYSADEEILREWYAAEQALTSIEQPLVELAEESVSEDLSILEAEREVQTLLDTEIVPAQETEAILQPVIEMAETEEGLQAPAVFTSVTAAENVSFNTKENRIVVDVEPLPTLTDDERLEIMFNRDLAFPQTLDHVRAEAAMYSMRMQNLGYDHFECRIDWAKPGFPIILRFSKEIGEAENRDIEKIDRHIKGYDNAYTELKVPLLPREVLLFMSTAEGVLLDDGFVSAVKYSGYRQPNLKDRGRFIPPIEDIELRDNGGMYYVVLKGPNLSSPRREIEEISFPLGLAVKDRSSEELKERDERVDYVTKMIREVTEAKGPRNSESFIRKGDALHGYNGWLAEEGKGWVTATRWVLPPEGMEPGQYEALSKDEKIEAKKLPGFHKGNLLLVSSQSDQKVSLGPVYLHLDPGGDNPSWHAHLTFHVGNKHSKSMGSVLCTHKIHLHTRNEALAVARTRESLTGLRYPVTGATLSSGLFQQIRNLAIATGQEWRIENQNSRAEQVVVCRMHETEADDSIQRHNDSIKAAYPIDGVSKEQSLINNDMQSGQLLRPILWPQHDPGQSGVITVVLHHLLEDMTRYERDIGVRQIGEPEPSNNGHVTIKLQATRSSMGDNAQKVMHPNPEDMFEKIGEERKPIQVSVPIPKNQIEKIDGFIKAIAKAMSEIAERESLSFYEDKEKKEFIRRSPKDYRTAQVRICLQKAVEQIYRSEEFFGYSLTKAWNQAAEQSTSNPERPVRRRRRLRQLKAQLQQSAAA